MAATPTAPPPPGRRLAQEFVNDLLRWFRALSWSPELGEVSWVELALDYEAFTARALPAAPCHRLHGTRLPLGERAQVLRKAAGLLEGHLAGGTLVRGRRLGYCRSLLPWGGAFVRVSRRTPTLRRATRCGCSCSG